MTEFEKGLSPHDIRDVERTATTLSRALNAHVGISPDLSITVGNVTFGHSIGLSPMDMADLYDYYADSDHHMSIDGGIPNAAGYKDQTFGPSDKPETFVKTLEPATGLRKLARRALFG